MENVVEFVFDNKEHELEAIPNKDVVLKSLAEMTDKYKSEIAALFGTSGMHITCHMVFKVRQAHQLV